MYHSNRSRPDITLILDNGAYEGRLDVGMFEERIAEFEPEVIVLPDIYLGNWERSLHLSLGYLDITHALQCEYMFCPQAEPGDMPGFMKALTAGLTDRRITWLAIPRCLATDIARNTLARRFVAEFVRKDYPHIKIHALGMVDGNPYELAYLAESGVYSCDSSAPVWRGICGYNLHEPLKSIDIQFDWVGDEIELNHAEQNLKEVDRACRYGIRLREGTTVQESVSKDSQSGGTQPHFN